MSLGLIFAGGKNPGYDRVRHAEIGNKEFELTTVEEAYTTEHWVVRIYKVKDLPNRGVNWVSAQLSEEFTKNKNNKCRSKKNP